MFASNRDKVGRSAKSIYSAIYTVRADGSELTRLSPDAHLPHPTRPVALTSSLPSFSRDGGQVVFARAPGVVSVMGSDGRRTAAWL